MTEEIARQILVGISPMPEDKTVEEVFSEAHVTAHVVTPF